MVGQRATELAVAAGGYEYGGMSRVRVTGSAGLWLHVPCVVRGGVRQDGDHGGVVARTQRGWPLSVGEIWRGSRAA